MLPLFGSAVAEVPLPDWPRMPKQAFETFLDHVEQRAAQLIPALLRQEVGSALLRWAVNAAWHLQLRGRVRDAVRGIVLADLIRRDQIDDELSHLPTTDPARLRNFSPEEREVVAAVANPQYDLRTESGLCTSTKLSPETVRAAIRKAMSLPDGAVHKVWEAPLRSPQGEAGYALASRRLPAYQTIPVVGAIARVVDKVTFG